jgi:hypothetical protein
LAGDRIEPYGHRPAEKIDLSVQREKRLEPKAETTDLGFAFPGRMGPQERNDPAFVQRRAGIPDIQMRVGHSATFHKHVGKLCNGVQIHMEGPDYDHQAFKPWRVQALAFKAIRRLYPDYPLWRDFAYEYEHGKLAIDVINGGPLLRNWVDDPSATPQDLDALTIADEQTWSSEREGYVCY